MNKEEYSKQGKKDKKSKISSSPSKVEQGKRNRAAGVRFEAKVRAGLEEMGWIVDKWTNTVDYDRDGNIGKVVPAKRKYNPFKKVMVIGTGFPDFICIKNTKGVFEVIGVEVKKKGYLDKIEKGMCYWLLENKVFSKILIAKAVPKGKRINVEYIDFNKKYGKSQ